MPISMAFFAKMAKKIPCEKLLTMLTKLGSQISSLNGITGLLKNYDNMMIGFEFTK